MLYIYVDNTELVIMGTKYCLSCKLTVGALIMCTDVEEEKTKADKEITGKKRAYVR